MHDYNKCRVIDFKGSKNLGNLPVCSEFQRIKYFKTSYLIIIFSIIKRSFIKSYAFNITYIRRRRKFL